jgi:hypothetical protein
MGGNTLFPLHDRYIRKCKEQFCIHKIMVFRLPVLKNDAVSEPVLWIRIGFNADPDPAVYPMRIRI